MTLQIKLIISDAIKFLLQKIGTYVDPQVMIQRIEHSLRIPGLKDALVKMMRDYNIQVSIQEGCKQILSNDYFKLHERLLKCHQKGFSIDGIFLLFIRFL